jgi:hypothetical protein
MNGHGSLWAMESSNSRRVIREYRPVREAKTGTIDVSSWSFALWYLVGTAVAWAVALYFNRLLARQNIVLSSKGC